MTALILALTMVAAFLAANERGQGVAELVNALLVSTLARRDALLSYFSRERLLSVAARKSWIEPDLAPIPPQPTGVAMAPALG